MVDTVELLKIYKTRDAALTNIFDQKKPIYLDIRNYLAPHTARFAGEKVNDGKRQDTNIINTSPREAVRTLPSGMQSGITSPMRPWFKLGTPDPALQKIQSVKEWLNTVQRLMLDTIGRSNLYDRLKSGYGTMGNYGTAAIFVDEDAQDTIRAYDLMFGSFRCATSATGRVDTLYRHTSMSAIQLVQRNKSRGWKLPELAKRAFDQGNYEERIPLLHIIEPNRNYDPNSDLPHKKLFASVWLDMSKDGLPSIIWIGGYDDVPHMCPRWDVVGEDTYGVGSGEIALGDSKGLQLLEKRSYQILDKIANPTMLADASLRNQRVSNLPGDTVYVNGMVSGRPGYAPAYQINNAPLAAIDAKGIRIEERIDRAYFKNLFLMVAEIADQPNITATQINAMREEKLLMLGPVLERLNDELLDPLIDRVFMVMQRNNLLPPPPPELQGLPLRVEYISVLAQAQKAIGIGNIERFVGFVGNMAGIEPSVLDRLNVDEVVEEYADGVAVPPQIVRSIEDATEIRDARNQQLQQQASLAAADAAAGTAEKLAKSDLSGDNALNRALESAGAAGTVPAGVPLNVSG